MNKQEILELIVDMIDANADEEEIYRAIRYSKDVLDCEKSYENLGILDLENKYGTTRQQKH